MRDALLRAFMRTWYRSREGALDSVPYPEDAPVARAPGPDPLRVLLVGNGAASGWGVRSHELALTGHLARALAARTGRGAQVDARVDRTRRLGELSALVDGIVLERFDAVVLVAGMNDAVNLTPIADWSRTMDELLRGLVSAAPEARVLVVGPQPVTSVSTYTRWPGRLADRHRRRMNRATVRLCAELGAAYLELPAPSRPPGEPGHRSPDVYGEWAAVLADALAPSLAAARRRRADEQPEPERQRATEAVRGDAEPDPRLDRITRLAASTLGARYAAVSMIDGAEQRNRSVAGTDLVVLPRSVSMCDHTIRQDGPLIVPDLSADPRFADSPVVSGPRHLRFYAGWPIESPDGYRIGALCVLDTEPRDAGSVDLDALAELAMLAQKRIWESAAPTPPPPATYRDLVR